MKKYLFIIGALVLLAGCVTKNPEYTGPNTNGVPAFVVDPRLASAKDQVKAVTDAVKPANPYAGITDYVVDGGFGLAAIISGLIARRKSKVADTIAAGAVKAGPAAVQTILDHAAEGAHFAAVADLVNVNTGSNQTITGQAKPS
jgi:hypothetical protein